MIIRMGQQNPQGIDRRSLLVRSGAIAAGALGATVAGVAAAAPAVAAVTPPAGLGYTPITPYRSFDSRPGQDRIGAGFYFVVQVITDEIGDLLVPATAQAVTFNLTITQTAGPPGYLGVVPAGTPEESFTTSNINWVSAGLDLANGGTTKIAADAQTGPGSVIVYCDGVPAASTHFIIDVTGYFSP